MLANKLELRLESSPLIICGPILRRVERDSVTVWVALRKPRAVTLQVFKRESGGGWAAAPVQAATEKTVAVGKNLHVVAVTATGRQLDWGDAYGYNLTFAPAPGEPADKAGTGDLFAGADAARGTTGVFAATAEAARRALTYAETNPQAPNLPSFVLPPDAARVPAGSHPLDHLRVCHGSCRKAHGESIDGLAAMDTIIRQSLHPGAPDPRPHMLLLTGDQIYADDVADAMLEMLVDAGDTLLGWPSAEKLPGEDYMPSPGNRAPFAERIGLTSMLKGKPEYAKSHLLRFGEYAAMYLFAWSDVLWPQELPRLSEVYYGYIEGIARSEQGERFEEERKRLQLLRETLPKVRRALANVPVYMIFDDHEISDDWNLNRDWCVRVLDAGGGAKKRAGRRVILNGMLAYAVFQAWGNTPGLFTQNDASAPGWLLLDALTKWRGGEDKHETEIFTRLGVPRYENGQPVAAAPSGPVMRWNHVIETPGFQCLMLDTRTMRGFPGEPQDPPDILNEEAFRTQIDEAPPPPADGVTVAVIPTNVVSEPLTELAADVIAKFKKTPYDSDKGDAWVPQSHAFETLLSKLANRAPDTGGPRRVARVVIASGDIHYGFAVRMQYWAESRYRRAGDPTTPGKPVDAVFAELTASSFKNEASLTRTLQERAFMTVKDTQLWKNLMTGSWVGWQRPPSLTEVAVAGELPELRVGVGPAVRNVIRAHRIKRRHELLYNSTPSLLRLDDLPLLTMIRKRPDWRYRLDFVRDETRVRVEDVTVTWRDNPPRGWYEQQMRLVSEAHRAYAESGSGRLVVGRNNVGEVRFHWGPGEDKSVTQKLWWRLTAETEPAPLTRYTILLGLNHDKYPKPTYPGER